MKYIITAPTNKPYAASDNTSNKSTSQQVYESTSWWSDQSDESDTSDWSDSHPQKNRITFLKLPKIQKFSDSIPKTSKFSPLFGFHS